MLDRQDQQRLSPKTRPASPRETHGARRSRLGRSMTARMLDIDSESATGGDRRRLVPEAQTGARPIEIGHWRCPPWPRRAAALAPIAWRPIP
jgi:hypothetical protein